LKSVFYDKLLVKAISNLFISEIYHARLLADFLLAIFLFADAFLLAAALRLSPDEDGYAIILVLAFDLRLATALFVDLRLATAFFLAAIVLVGFLLGLVATTNYCHIIR